MIFFKDKNPKQIMQKLAIYAKRSLDPNSTLLFLDEIQEPLTIKLDQVYSNIENQIRMDKFQSVIDERIKNIKKDAKIIIK